MTVTTQKRTEKKNALDQIKPVNKLDELKDLKVDNSNIKLILKDYEDSLVEASNKEVRNWINIDERYNSVLSPKEIRFFADFMTDSYEDHKNFEAITGIFISNLVQKSYDAGHNNFKFGTNNKDHFGYNIKGTTRNPLIITMQENNGWKVGHGAKNTKFNIGINNGKVLCHYLTNSSLNIKINNGSWIGTNSTNSTFNIEENNGNYIGFDPGWPSTTSKQCVFESINKETLDSLYVENTYSTLKRQNYFNLIQPQPLLAVKQLFTPQAEEIPYTPKKK